MRTQITNKTCCCRLPFPAFCPFVMTVSNRWNEDEKPNLSSSAELKWDKFIWERRLSSRLELRDTNTGGWFHFQRPQWLTARHFQKARYKTFVFALLLTAIFIVTPRVESDGLGQEVASSSTCGTEPPSVPMFGEKMQMLMSKGLTLDTHPFIHLLSAVVLQSGFWKLYFAQCIVQESPQRTRKLHL